MGFLTRVCRPGCATSRPWRQGLACRAYSLRRVAQVEANRSKLAPLNRPNAIEHLVPAHTQRAVLGAQLFERAQDVNTRPTSPLFKRRSTRPAESANVRSQAEHAERDVA